MNIFFRTDASFKIGTGHVMRCLTLAQALRERGGHCRFICREHPGNLLDWTRQAGFESIALPLSNKRKHVDLAADESVLPHATWLGSDWQTDASQTIASFRGCHPDWVIVDHYSLDHRWETQLRTACEKIMVIDDLADRRHDADVLLDQNFYLDKDRRYQGLLPKHCKALIGPAYFLLRTEFTKAKQGQRTRDGRVKRIIVFFGGSDPENQTQTVLDVFKKMRLLGVAVDVVVTQSNPNRHSIKLLCDQLLGVTYHCNVSNMAELIVNADLGVGAGGSSMWERCYLGLPTITVVFAKNQVRTTEDVAKLGAIEYLGWADLLGGADYQRVISDLIGNAKKMRQISDTALTVMQKLGTYSVVDEMLNLQQQKSTMYSSIPPCTIIATN